MNTRGLGRQKSVGQSAERGASRAPDELSREPHPAPPPQDPPSAELEVAAVELSREDRGLRACLAQLAQVLEDLPWIINRFVQSHQIHAEERRRAGRLGDQMVQQGQRLLDAVRSEGMALTATGD